MKNRIKETYREVELPQGETKYRDRRYYPQVKSLFFWEYLYEDNGEIKTSIFFDKNKFFKSKEKTEKLIEIYKNSLRKPNYQTKYHTN